MAHRVSTLVDPLSLIVPTEIYVMLQEKLHTHVPMIDALKQVLAQASPERRAFMAMRAKSLGEVADAVIKTINVAQR